MSVAYALLLRWEKFKLAISETWLRLRGVKGGHAVSAAKRPWFYFRWDYNRYAGLAFYLRIWRWKVSWNA